MLMNLATESLRLIHCHIVLLTFLGVTMLIYGAHADSEASASEASCTAFTQHLVYSLLIY